MWSQPVSVAEHVDDVISQSVTVGVTRQIEVTERERHLVAAIEYDRLSMAATELD